MFDLIVIGGGPAGTAAAITCARQGRRVLLLERGRLPRHKVCGEFVSAESLELLRGLLADAELLESAPRISRARIFVDGRLLVTAVEPPAASIARIDLDHALWHSAERCGIEAKQQTSAQNLVGSGPFQLSTNDGTFETRAVVNASGRWSNLRTATSTNNNADPKWIGIKAHFLEASPAPSVDLYFFDGGYCGVQPVRVNGEPRINACAMVRADVASTLDEVFRLNPALLKRAGGWQACTEPITVAPLRFRTPQPLRGNVLLAGDAAGFVDPFIGDGISLAFRSGVLAAQCLENFFRGEVLLQNASLHYEREYQRQFAPVFQSSSKIRRILQWPNLVRKPIVSFLAKTPAVTEYLVRRTR